MDIHQKETVSIYMNLLEKVKDHQMLEKIYKLIPLSSARIDSKLRMKVLRSQLSYGKIPSSEILRELLKDPSSDMRLLAVEVGGKYLKEEKLIVFLKQAIIGTPYPVRLKTLEMITSLPLQKKKEFADVIEHCKLTDPNDSVRNSCRQISF